MIHVLSTSLGILQESGYTARLSRQLSVDVLCFEDDSLIGCICDFPDPTALLSSWRGAEEAFLRANANRFRVAGEKAWNVYCVFLTVVEGDERRRREIKRIEEDLNRTRKLAMSGVSNKQLLTDTLLPLLPLQQKPVLETEDYEQRLRRRLARTVSPLVENAADESTNPEDIAKILRELA
jgi:hypothetical protein